MFSSLVEGIEASARLVARYVIIEKLYLRYESEAALGLQEAIKNLYATVPTYLARVKTYFIGGTLSKWSTAFCQWRSSLLYKEVFTHICLKNVSVEHFSRRCGTSTQNFGKRFQRLKSKTGPGWLKQSVSMLDCQSEAQTYGMKVQQRAREDATEQDQMLKDTLADFKTPIVQMSDQISSIHDTFNSKIFPLYVP